MEKVSTESILCASSGDRDDSLTETDPVSQETSIEVEAHGLKAKVFFNRIQEEIVPARFLRKADKSHPVNRNPWVFRSTEDARQVNLKKWSKIDIRYRGVFQTLKKVPRFTNGLYKDDGGRLDSGTSKSNFGNEAVKAQTYVVYALLDEIFRMLDITREAEDESSCFFLRPRLTSTQPEYWTGYRVKHKDTPHTAGSIVLDYCPERGTPRSVLPVSTTSKQQESLKSTLEGKFKLLLAQLLNHIHRLSPPGDKLPDQEAFLIGLHGSRLHVFRAIFPGQKTSKLWSGRHNNSTPENEPSQHLTTKISERFYTKQNVERFMELVEWHQLSNPDKEPNPQMFQILASHEYDLWMKSDFKAAVKLLTGLVLYLMSGHARCGILQNVFERYPYDESMETDSEDEYDPENLFNEQKNLEKAEKRLEKDQKRKAERDRERAWVREAMRTSTSDQIRGLQAFRQPWWDWVWEDKTDEGRAKDHSDIIFRGL